MKPAYKILKEVRELLKNPKNWGKFGMYDSISKRFCLVGALCLADAERNFEAISKLVKAIQIHHPTITSLKHIKYVTGNRHSDYWTYYDVTIAFNDRKRTKHSDVMKVLNTAIRLAR